MKKKCRSLLSFTVLVLKMLQRYILRIPPSISTFTDIDVVKKVFLGFLAKRNCSPFLYSPSVPVHSPYWCRSDAFGNVNSQSSSMYTGFAPRSLLLDHLGPPLPTSSFVISHHCPDPITQTIQYFLCPKKARLFQILASVHLLLSDSDRQSLSKWVLGPAAASPGKLIRNADFQVPPRLTELKNSGGRTGESGV